MESIRISIIQNEIVWEDRQENLRLLREKLKSLSGTTEIVVLSEMFSTGFSLHNKAIAETNTDNTIASLKQWADEYQVAICGSFMATDRNRLFNRGFFVTPQGKEYYYDKRHLFRMGQEAENFSPGDRRLIIPYLGWNICLMICYDLRFPVWIRNRNNEYDLLIVVANWPTSRRPVWDALLCARALENQSYVCGVNRTGTDGYGLKYNGGSALYSPYGDKIAALPDNADSVSTRHISLTDLQQFREKFPVWKDADCFDLKP